ncbi:MAG TPA: F0F1 ATP synthase subunit B [Chitinophagaceae bacterium]
MDLLTPDFGLIFWTLLAFLIVFFILGKYAWPAIVGGLLAREQGIAEAIASAEKVKAEMATLKNENEALLAQAREERAAMIKDAKATADKMVSEAKEKARMEYDRILTDAQAAINQQKMAALTDVKNQVGALVVEVSEKILRRELSDKQQQEKYINDLAGDIKLN